MAHSNRSQPYKTSASPDNDLDTINTITKKLNINNPYRKYPPCGVPCPEGSNTFHLTLRREKWWQMLQEHAWKETVMMGKMRIEDEKRERLEQIQMRQKEEAEEEAKLAAEVEQKKQRKDSLVTEEKDVGYADTKGAGDGGDVTASAICSSSDDENGGEVQPQQTKDVKGRKKNRQKRKAESLAQEIFGKDRRQSTPQNNSNRKSQTPLGGSLASRVGITKARSETTKRQTAYNLTLLQRSSSAASIPTLGKQQQSRGNQKNRNNRQSLGGADTRRDAAYQTAAQQAPPASFNIKSRSFAPVDSEITVRGAAGPYCVVASNFAPGTTAADIESVMAPVGGDMSGCKLISTSPNVIAEMLFLDRTGADNVINMFNGKKADGRTLYVYLKEGGPSQSIHSATPRIASPVVIAQPEPVQEQGAEDTMEIEQPYPTEPSPLPPHEPSPRPAYNNSRSRDGRASYREDYDRGDRHAQPEYQDGRYGFNEQRYNEPRYDDRRPRYRDEGRMYSDDVMRGGSRRGGGGRGGGRYRG
ncbi:hypothetical protein E4T50_09549 [Aureobasidium sp. EXF-12298]|nr:hypothetical protein E4T50_09549 [Aureobasidium sp. EXF-12298]